MAGSVQAAIKHADSATAISCPLCGKYYPLPRFVKRKKAIAEHIAVCAWVAQHG